MWKSLRKLIFYFSLFLLFFGKGKENYSGQATSLKISLSIAKFSPLLYGIMN